MRTQRQLELWDPVCHVVPIIYSFFPSLLVIGEKELNNGTVNVRSRENKVLGEHTVEHLIERFKEFCATRTVSAETEL